MLLAAFSILSSSRERVSLVLRHLPCGCLHRTSHNIAACFLKATKGRDTPQISNIISCIIIAEMTIQPLCHILLVKSHRSHLCARRGTTRGRDYREVEVMGPVEPVCPWVFFCHLLFQLVHLHEAFFNFRVIFLIKFLRKFLEA